MTEEEQKELFAILEAQGGQPMRYFHKGSSCHSSGNPMARGSTIGLLANRDLSSMEKMLFGSMALSQ